ncbi:MAG: hypothetical protein O3B84_06505 [Chloroflexi bacterium]|nr:hypothetical protein [Chloroflexota bacterium]
MGSPLRKTNLWKAALALTVVAMVAGMVVGADTADRTFRKT